MEKYKYLLTYRYALIIHDLTVEFVKKTLIINPEQGTRWNRPLDQENKILLKSRTKPNLEKGRNKTIGRSQGVF